MESNKKHIVWGVYVNLCRFALAFVFIFSGFVKGNDPLGFEYKLADYVVAFGLGDFFPDFILMPLAVGLSVLEFVLGIYLSLGINRRLASCAVLALMVLMTPFTLYLALENPVSDCGCFGDAVQLTNWQTFWKNLLLLAMAVSVFVGCGRIFRVVTPRIEWLLSSYALIYMLMFVYYNLQHLPVLDFRPYHIGADIREGMKMPEGEHPPVYETVFVMEKDGKQVEFSVENYPDTTWTFVSRRTVLREEGYMPPVHDFSIVCMEDGEDITDKVLSDKGYTFLLVAHHLEDADDGYIDLVNELYDYSRVYGYAFYALTASMDEQIEAWQDCTGAEYPFCNMDDITLKTIIRDNPGVVLLKGGVVINKWSQRDIPDEYQLTDALERLPEGQLQMESMAFKVGRIALCFLIPLLVILLVDRILRSKGIDTHDAGE